MSCYYVESKNEINGYAPLQMSKLISVSGNTGSGAILWIF